MSANPSTGRSVAGYRHGQVPRRLRERQVLDLAEELFAERGYEGASMDELARRAGVSKPVVYGLVDSKEALFHRCFERAAEELAESVAAAAAGAAGDLADLLRVTAVAFLRFVEEHRRAWAVLFALDTGGRTGLHVREIRARQAQLAAAALAERARAAGATPDPRRLEAVAYALNGAFEALAHWWRDNPDVGEDTAAQWLVDFALPGLAPLVGDRSHPA